ncbi:MAG TPA: iron-containing alcohol dehydrogenase [Pirellulales bacterium]
MDAINLQYDFLAPPRIVFGWGRRLEVGTLAAELGRRAFVVSGSRRLAADGLIDELTSALANAGVAAVPLAEIHREPLVEDVDCAAATLRDERTGDGDFVLAIGGGSALDLAKAAAAMVTNGDGASVRDFLEGVGRGLSIEHPPLPLFAMPTTGGTGSEATKNAVISSHDPTFKKSLRSDRMIARIVLVDPELSVSVPPKVTAQTGMDAITQLIESYISRRAQPIPRALAVGGLQRALPAIVEAVHDGTSRRAREAMAHAALLSGMALANSGLGMAHGVAAALGVVCDVPHGLACAIMLPAALKANRGVAACDFAELHWATTDSRDRQLVGDVNAAADAFMNRIERICRDIGIPARLSEISVRPDQIPALVRQSRGNSMSGNPREITDDELTRMLTEVL